MAGSDAHNVKLLENERWKSLLGDCVKRKEIT